MPIGFTESEKKMITKRLLEEGYKKFAVYGLKKTNIEELAKAAGISKGAFYLFFNSKEALFMDVIEMAEKHFRQEVLAAIALPGLTPRTRLYEILKKAFTLIKNIPVLQFLTGSDYDQLFRRIPAEKLQEHLANDRAFFKELIAQCQKAGIFIQVQPEQISGMLYPLVLTFLHKDNLGPNDFCGNIDLLLELIAAYCLGEIEIQVQKPINHTPQSELGYLT